MSSLSPLGALANVLSTGVGIGAANALVPPAQKLANEAWREFPDQPLDPIVLAQGVAEGQVDRDWAESEALNMGVDGGRFARLVKVFDSGPGVAYAFELWRRGKIGEAAFRRALKREALEEEWIDDLAELKQRILTPAELAVMVQRGVVPDPGYLPVGPPSGRGKVQPMPVAQIDTAEEAAGSGYNHERMAALTRIIGLPASPDLAARMVFRKIIERVDFDRAISEGNTRNEWRDPLFEGFREIPTAHNGIEARLRGWIDDAGMYEQTARHGMSKADTDLLFKVQGRPLSFHQVWIGLQRGGVYDGPTGDIDPAFLKALRESNIRPEWYNLAWHQRYTYPSAFVMRALTQDGTLTGAQAEADLIDMGWRPDRAAQAAGKWAAQGDGGGSSYVGKAQTQLWATTHSAYVARLASEGDVQGAFDLLEIPAADRPFVLGAWMAERDLTRVGLTKAEIKKAVDVDGFTRDDAIGRLEALGMSFEDANLLLDE